VTTDNGDAIAEGENVITYFNLHKGLFSVKAKRRRTWSVHSHHRLVLLDNPTFVVSAAGRARVLQEGQKNVHASVRGRWVSAFPDSSDGLLPFASEVTYSPYRHDTFVHVSEPGTPCRSGSRAALGLRDIGRVFHLNQLQAADCPCCATSAPTSATLVLVVGSSPES
jgi:hypothetical protein